MKRAWIAAWAFGLMLLLPLCAGLAETTDGEDDYTWLKRGYATMTVLTYDLTHDAATKALAGWI